MVQVTEECVTQTAEQIETRRPETSSLPPIGPRRLIARIALGLVLFAVLAIAAVMFAPASFWHWLIVHEVSRSTGRAASAGDVRVHLFSLNPELSVEDLAIANFSGPSGLDDGFYSSLYPIVGNDDLKFHFW